MTSPRRAVLLAMLTVALALFLLDAHGSVRQMLADFRVTWNDIRKPAEGTAP